MRIAIFTDTYFPHINGVSSSIERAVYAFESHKLNYVLISPTPTPVGFPIKSFRLRCVKDKRYGLDIPIIKISELIKRWKADVVHIHTPFAFGLLGLLYGKKINAKIVYTHHTNLDAYLHYVPLLNNDIGRKLLNFYMRWFISKTNIVMVPSQNTASLLATAKITHDHVVVLPTPLDPVYHSCVQNKEDKIYDVLFVGTLSKEKNLDLLIEVIDKLVNVWENVAIAIVGNGIDKKRVLSLMEFYERYNIKYLGELNKYELLKIYLQSKLLFSPSVTETQGLTIQEALSQGIPVVAVYCDQIKEFVRHNYNGILLPADAIKIANAISSLLEEEQQYEWMSRNCATSVTDFSIENWYDKYASVVFKEGNAPYGSNYFDSRGIQDFQR